MKIFITGGAGYIGSALVNYLINLKDNHSLTVIDNFYKGRSENLFPAIQKFKDRLSLHKLDIRDKDKIKDLLEQLKPDIIIHLASIVDAFTTNSPDKEILCKEVIRDGTINLWNIAKDLGSVKLFINTSSVSLYSKGKNITEDGEKDPISVYAKMKLEAENAIMITQDYLKTVSLRPATVTGYAPGIRYETVINLFTMYAVTNQVIPIFYEALDGEKTFLDINDLCRAYHFCIDNSEKVTGSSYNVTSYNITMREVLDILSKHFPNLNTKLIHSSGVNQQVYTVSGEKFCKLGFVPKPDLNKQIVLMKKYFSKQAEINEELFRDNS
ncbi:NAD(P)-dependent oxidoreductase [archaeon]|nr:NAD(P)-dependent oxidoreductase [archaeon]